MLHLISYLNFLKFPKHSYQFVVLWNNFISNFTTTVRNVSNQRHLALSGATWQQVVPHILWPYVENRVCSGVGYGCRLSPDTRVFSGIHPTPIPDTRVFSGIHPTPIPDTRVFSGVHPKLIPDFRDFIVSYIFLKIL